MLTISFQQWQQWLAEYWWTLARISGCLMVAPVFGARVVPRRFRIGMSLALTVMIAPLVTLPKGIELFSGLGMVITAQQLLIGLALGFCVQLVFFAIEFGGQLLANGIGLSYAMNVDPMHGSSTPVIGQFYTILMTLVFLALNGHLLMIESLVQSFTLLPVGPIGLSRDGLWLLVRQGDSLFSGALMFALPGVVAALVVNLAFGVMSRAAPAMNLFGVGFPAILAFGLVITVLILPGIEAQFVRQLSAVWMTINDILTASRPVVP